MRPTTTDLLAEAAQEPTDTNRFNALVERIADRVMAARYPWKSLAAVEREALKAEERAGAGEVRAVVERVAEIVDLAEATPKDSQAGAWLSPSQAAESLGVPVSWVLEKLETEEGRRVLGQPWYDGRRWHIPAAACDPHQRGSYLSTLPPSEPSENTALLSVPAGNRPKGATPGCARP